MNVQGMFKYGNEERFRRKANYEAVFINSVERWTDNVGFLTRVDSTQL